MDLLHFSNVSGDIAAEEALTAEEETSVAEKRVLGARLIVPGFATPGGKLSLVNWPNRAMRPTLSKMRAEIKIRNSNSRPDYHFSNKCIEILRNAPCLGEEISSLFNKVVSTMKKIKQSKNRDTPRLVNIIMELQEECLLRDAKLGRKELDTGDINSFFSHGRRNLQSKIQL